MNSDGSNQINLTNSAPPFHEANPAWSPDGSKIAFSGQDADNVNRDIYVMNADGSNVKLLTRNLAVDISPTWSPDGSKIAFESNRDHLNEFDNAEIYVMNADGSNVVRLTNNTANDYIPDWGRITPDTTPPQLINLPADITEEATGPAGAQVSWQAPTATDENPTHPIVSCSPASGSTFAIGTTTVNCSATDAANNTANGSFTVKVQDTTGPNITNVPSDITTDATSSAGATVNFTKPTATDAVDGDRTVSCSPASGSLFPIGTTQVNCSAADVAGNQASGSFQVKVVYAFGSGSGGSFGEPVRSTELNQLAAGGGVPVKFGLGADYGLNIFAAGYPTSKKIDCNTGLPTDPVEETATVTKSGLTYDAASGLYTYVWKTDRGRGRAPAGNSTLS
jgi:HYR domain/WD40-like Beta Propeller Repeat